MKLLLDTHAFLWYITADPKLPATFLAAIRDPANDVFLSAASVWEAVIKHQLGKLPFPAPPAGYLPQQRDAHGIAALPIDEGAMDASGRAPVAPPRPVRPPARGTSPSARPDHCHR